MNVGKICFGCMSDKGPENICPNCGWAQDAIPESSLHLKPGTILKGQYLLGRVLGHGGFGITYLACDINLGTKLAIKEYFPQGMATRGMGDPTISVYSGGTKEHFEYGLDKFLEEARTLSRFDDVPEIVAIRDFFKENGTAYIVMSYVDGITLKEYIDKSGGKLPLDAVLNIMLPVMKALEQLHKTGLLHRDISPDNIYITKNFNVKLLDFGAARYAIGGHSKSLSVLLKPGYAPEEQYRSKGYQGPWTDVYAVGATVYKALTGTTPPEAMDRFEVDEILPISPEIAPAYIGDAILKALALKSKDRFQSINEFQEALSGVAGNRNKNGFMTESNVAPENSVQVVEKLKGESDNIPVKPELGGFISGNTNDGINSLKKTGNSTKTQKKSKVLKVLKVFCMVLLMGLGIGIVLGGIEYLNYSVIPYSNIAGIFIFLLATGLIYRNHCSTTVKASVIKISVGLALVIGSAMLLQLEHYSFSSDDFLILGPLVDIVFVSGIWLILQHPRIIMPRKLWGAAMSLIGILILLMFDKICPFEWHHIGAVSGLLILTVGGSVIVSSSNEKRQNGTVKEVIFYCGILLVAVGMVYAYNIYFSPSRFVEEEFSFSPDNGEYYTIYGKGLFYERYTQKVCSDEIRIFRASGDTVYYANHSDSSKLFKINRDGSGRTKINNDKPGSLFVYKGSVFYTNLCDSGTIYKVGETGKREKLNWCDSYIVSVIDDWVYYINWDKGNRLYKIRTDGTGEEEICSDLMEYVMIEDKYIFYSNESDNGNLYKINRDGSGRERLSKERARVDFIFGYNVYFNKYASFWNDSCKVEFKNK